MFYLFFWAAWLVTSLFLDDSTVANRISVLSLLIICTSSVYLSNHFMKISIGALVILIVSIGLTWREWGSQPLLKALKLLSIIIVYGCGQMFLTYQNQIIRVNSTVLLSAIVIISALFISRNYQEVLGFSILGVFLGELAWSIYLSPYPMLILGGDYTLDVISFILFLFIFLYQCDKLQKYKI